MEIGKRKDTELHDLVAQGYVSYAKALKSVKKIGDGTSQIFEIAHPNAPEVIVSVIHTDSGLTHSGLMTITRYVGGVRISFESILEKNEFTAIIIG